MILLGTLCEGAEFLTVPLSTWGAALTPQEKIDVTRRLLAEEPVKAETLDNLGKQVQEAGEQLGGMKRTLAAYGPELERLEPEDVKELGQQLEDIPEPEDPRLGNLAPPDVHTNPWWAARSLRNTASYGVDLAAASGRVPAAGTERSGRQSSWAPRRQAWPKAPARRPSCAPDSPGQAWGPV